MSRPPLDLPRRIADAAVHSSLYTDPEVFAWEMHAVFEQGWCFVAHESEIPQAGDYVRRTLGLTEVIVCRDRDGGVQVIANRCSHRGNLLCHEESGRRKNFVCQFHGWVFSLQGQLLDVPFPAGAPASRERLALKQARAAVYRGFVFATFAKEGEGRTLEEHLGRAREWLDQAADLSPLGRLQLDGGWGRHLMYTNWKLLAENDTDGYHVHFVHDSFARGIKVQGKYEHVLVTQEERLEPISRDFGDGHVDLHYGPAYRQPLIWLGTEPDRYPAYTAAMKQKYGEQRAYEIMRVGPPHAFIFPNLFIAEGTLTMIQPLAPGQTVNWNTPLYLEGAPSELNTRLLRQVEAAVGASAFLLADDATMSERQFHGLQRTPGWLDVSRGLHREETSQDGVITSHFSDETPNRGIWRHYRKLAQAAVQRQAATEAA